MVKIQLTRGLVALIDSEDEERVLAQGRWQARLGANTWYAGTAFKIPGTRKNRIVLLHRFLMGCTEGDGLRVDHKDEDGLNCQKYNLRIASASLNAHNRTHKLANNTSGYEGVYWSNQKNKWVGEIVWEGKKIYCGAHSNIIIIAAKRETMKAELMLKGETVSFREVTLDDLI